MDCISVKYAPQKLSLKKSMPYFKVMINCRTRYQPVKARVTLKFQLNFKSTSAAGLLDVGLLKHMSLWRLH